MDQLIKNHSYFIKRAIELAEFGMKNGFGGPFGAVIVKDGEIISEGYNMVTSTNDPTAHAEIVAIRKACLKVESFRLDECIIYSSCEPCPMCMGAIYWARPRRLVFAAGRIDAAEAGFDDSFIYNELSLPFEQRHLEIIHYHDTGATAVFDQWKSLENIVKY